MVRTIVRLHHRYSHIIVGGYSQLTSVVSMVAGMQVRSVSSHGEHERSLRASALLRYISQVIMENKV